MSAEGPFTGVTVLEFGQFVAVPYAGQLLADGGARVIKIEPPEGEPSRHIAPLAPGVSRHFLIRNRGKHALPLDLRHPDAPEIIAALLGVADVLLLNMRPGLATRLGLDGEQLAPRYPRLIVATVTAYGPRGPDAARAGMDHVVQARSGLMVTGGRTKDGLPTSGESPIADYMAASLLAFGVASALFQRERTGRGARVDTSLLAAALALQNNLMVRIDAVDGPRHAAFREWLAGARRTGIPHAEQAARMPRSRPAMSDIYGGTYATRDSAIAVACGSPSLRRRFMRAVGLEDPALDGRVAADELPAHYAQLRREIDAVMAARTAADWQDVLDDLGVPASTVALPIEMLDAEQPTANGLFHRFEHPRLGPVTVLAPPLAHGDGGFAAAPLTPPLGSETREILTWAGFSEPDLGRLLRGGAVTPRGTAAPGDDAP